MTLPEGRPGKILALGVCCLLVALVGLSVVRPAAQFHGQMHDELRLLDAQRLRLAKLENALPKLREQVEELKKQKESNESNLLLSDSSDSVAAAELQTKIQALGTSLGADISSVESLAARREDGFRRIGIRVMIVCDQKALTGLLKALTTAQPPLFVDNLEIRNGNQMAPQGGVAPKLNIGLEIYGYRVASTQTADSQG